MRVLAVAESSSGSSMATVKPTRTSKEEDGAVTPASRVAANGKEWKPERKAKQVQGRRRMRADMADRPMLEPNAAGIDIGAREMYVAVPADRDDDPVRVFDT